MNKLVAVSLFVVVVGIYHLQVGASTWIIRNNTLGELSASMQLANRTGIATPANQGISSGQERTFDTASTARLTGGKVEHCITEILIRGKTSPVQGLSAYKPMNNNCQGGTITVDHMATVSFANGGTTQAITGLNPGGIVTPGSGYLMAKLS